MRNENFKRKRTFGKSSDSPNRSGGKSRFGGGGGGRSNKRKKTELNPDSLINEAKPIDEKPYIPERTFSELPLDGRLKDRIANKGFVNPTEIQDKTIEDLIAGHDLMGIANTGTGKTGAFIIPVIQQLLTSGAANRALILVPTRELALQVEEEFKSLTQGLKLFCTCLIGGTSVGRNIQQLRRTNHVIIGTPGRVQDLIDRRALRLQNFSTLILDEFDRMLDMGFVNDVMRITDEMIDKKQTILFSATVNNKQKTSIAKLLDNPKEVRVSSGKTSAGHIEQNIVRIGRGEDKFDVLLNVIKQDDCYRVLVFAETKRWVGRLTTQLKKAGVMADEIHGDKSQSYRQRALQKFKAGKIQVLVATDVAARGIDVDDISLVVNYELPQDMESYVHRIGRTGRAGKPGKALTLVA